MSDPLTQEDLMIRKTIAGFVAAAAVAAPLALAAPAQAADPSATATLFGAVAAIDRTPQSE